jgi:hypothetical protein
MTIDSIVLWIVSTIVTILLGALSYFVKRTMSELDQVRRDYVTRGEVNDMRESISDQLSKLNDKFDQQQGKMLTESTFVRTVARLEGMIDGVRSELLDLHKRGGMQNG